MAIVLQGRAATQEYDGLTASTGLVDFATVLPADWARMDRRICPVISWVALENAFAESLLFDCFLLAPGEAINSLERVTIRRETAQGFSSGGCGIQVPRDENGEPWTLRLVTPVLAQPAMLVVVADLGTVIPA